MTQTQIERPGRATFAALLVAACAAASCSAGGAPPPSPPVNAPPSADAGPDQTSVEGASVFLAGAGADPDGAIASYRWRQVSGPAVLLDDPGAPTASFIAPLVPDSRSVALELSVTDTAGARAVDQMIVTIDPAARGAVVAQAAQFDGVRRAFAVYTPASFQAGDGAVLLLHGGGQSMRKVLEPAASTSRWRALSDREGFVLIVPNGFNETARDGEGDQQSWNDLRDDRTGRTSNQDDIGFILSVLDAVANARPFARDAVYATGSSNGGMMSMRLVVEAPDRIAAAASFIAALPEETIADPIAPTPILIQAGTDDPLVLFDGGPVGEGGAPSRSVTATRDYFLRNTNAVVAGAASRMLPDDDPADGCIIFETLYSTADGAPAVAYYEARGGGHAIPDRDAAPFSPAAEAVLGKRCRDATGVDLAWAYFSAAP